MALDEILLSTPLQYLMYGLRVESDIDLPGWPRAAGEAPANVTIRHRSLPMDRSPGAPYTAQGVLENDRVDLYIRGVGAYCAADGTRIDVDPDPSAAPEDVLLYLTGAMLGVILHLRGAYPLHASCVTLGPGGGGIAFAGPSGAGKSTLVSAFLDRGGGLVTDDVAVLFQTEAGQTHAWPGARRVKLDDGSLTVLKRPKGDGRGLERAGGNRGKFHVAVEGALLPPTPVAKVYILHEEEGPVRTENLSGVDAVAALVEHTYLLGYASGLGRGRQCFRLAAEVARTVPVARLIRPRGFQHLGPVLDLIEQEARTAQDTTRGDA